MLLVPEIQSNSVETKPLNTTNHCDFSPGRKRNAVQCSLVWIRRGAHGAVLGKLDDPKEKREKGREALSYSQACTVSQSPA